MPLTVAFDASGKKSQHPLVVVAGFVSSLTDWELFSDEWEGRLRQDDMACFHRTEIHNYFPNERDEVQRMQRLKRLLDDLMCLIQRYAYAKVGCIVPLKNLDKLPPDLRKLYRLEAYVYAARSSVGSMHELLKEDHWPADIKYIFESGDGYDGPLIKRLETDGFATPIFRSKKDQIRADGSIWPRFVPLQAADWLAHTYFSVGRAYLEGQNREDIWAFREFERKPGTVSIMLEESADHLQEMVRIAGETQYLDYLR